MGPTQPTIDSGTGSADYSAAYFHDYSGPPYTYDEPHWKNFFGTIADSIIALFGPATTYDAGCAKGFLVRSLAERGVDASGGDISQFAIADAPSDLAARLEVRDLTNPFEHHFDLITCIEVLEHMSPEHARVAVANLCAATDRIVLSTTADDFAEATHINIRQPGAWAQDFAVHGFFRRTDIDAGFVSPWAVVLERSATSPVELVARYEALLAPLLREVDTKRRTLLQVRRELDESISPVIGERDRLAAEVASLRARLAEDGEPAMAERVARLAMLDELVGLRAKVARLETEAASGVAGLERAGLQESIAVLSHDVARTKDQLLTAERALADRNQSVQAQVGAVLLGRDRQIAEIKQSTTWRVGEAILTPFRPARRLLRRESR